MPEAAPRAPRALQAQGELAVGQTPLWSPGSSERPSDQEAGCPPHARLVLVVEVPGPVARSRPRTAWAALRTRRDSWRMLPRTPSAPRDAGPPVASQRQTRRMAIGAVHSSRRRLILERAARDRPADRHS